MTSHTDWNLAATLEWIYYRDEERCVARLPVEDRGDMIIALAQMRAVRQGLDNINASELLHKALRNGEVIATGKRGRLNDSCTLTSDLWQHLEIGGHQAFGKSVLALPRGRTHSPTSRNLENVEPIQVWTDILFKRESVIAAFPPVAPDLVSSIVPGQNFDADAWRVQAGETCKAWMARPEVSQEAVRRLRDGGTGKASIPGVLTLMARECSVKFSQDTIRKNVKLLRETT